MILSSADEKTGNPCEQDPDAPINETVFKRNASDRHAVDKREVSAGQPDRPGWRSVQHARGVTQHDQGKNSDQSDVVLACQLIDDQHDQTKSK